MFQTGASFVSPTVKAKGEIVERGDRVLMGAETSCDVASSVEQIVVRLARERVPVSDPLYDDLFAFCGNPAEFRVLDRRLIDGLARSPNRDSVIQAAFEALSSEQAEGSAALLARLLPTMADLPDNALEACLLGSIDDAEALGQRIVRVCFEVLARGEQGKELMDLCCVATCLLIGRCGNYSLWHYLAVECVAPIDSEVLSALVQEAADCDRSALVLLALLALHERGISMALAEHAAVFQGATDDFAAFVLRAIGLDAVLPAGVSWESGREADAIALQWLAEMPR